MRIRYLLPIFLLLASVISAQDPPVNGDYFPIDEFGAQHCDEFKARIDNFYIQLNLNATDVGYFVVRGSKDTLAKRLAFELMLASAIADRQYDPKRVVVIRGEESGPLNVQLWVWPGSDTDPPFHKSQWDLTMSPQSEPFLLRTDMDAICSPSPLGKIAQELFSANPEGRIYVIVHGPTRRTRRAELKVAMRRIAALGTTRVRYFVRRADTPYSDYFFAVGDRDRRAF